MKITFAIKSVCCVRGGAERVLVDISKEFVDKGYDVSLLTFDKPKSTPVYDFNPNIRQCFMGLGQVDRPSTFIEAIRRVLALRKVIKAERPDVVIAFMHSMFVPLSFALAGTGIPVVASEHIVPAHYHGRKVEFFLLCLSALFVKKITVLSDDVKKSYPKFLQKKMVAVANPVKRAHQYKNYAVSGDAPKKILNVGRLTDQKNQKLLITAFSLIVEKYPDWSLQIIGEGELHNELQCLIERLGLQERVMLFGATNDIESAYLDADIFAMSSDYESFGLALVEAMGHGLPVIGFADCPGVNELIKHNENGLLISADGRVDNFSKGLEVLMRSEELREKMGRKGIETAIQFAPEIVSVQWEALLSDFSDSH